MDIEKNLDSVRERILKACQRSSRNISDITLVAVTKGVNSGDIQYAYELGVRNFGENRVQEAETKIAELYRLKPDICWHMIGHLQSNKAKQSARLFDIIESVDSVKLAAILNQQSLNPPLLLEINVSGEKTKNGFKEAELNGAIQTIKEMTNLKVTGLMTVAPVVANPEEARPVFRRLKELAEELELNQLSMGMTDDFEVAIEEGATIIRLGRAIFGERRI